MKSLITEATHNTPTINFDPEKGLLEIKGKSIPENSIGFYKPVLEWLEEYLENAAPQTNVNVHLEYFNTASSKCLLDVFKALDSIHKANKSKMTINWLYDEDDDDMMEAGEDYDAIISVPFNMIPVEEE
ncbi:MAG: DUF1987 domain-containing protein [Bacteroidota bacterium]